MRIALFTDTFDQTNGVAHTFRQFAAHCQAREVELDIFTTGDHTSVEPRGSVTVHRFEPLRPVRYYERLSVDLAYRRDLLHTFAQRSYDLVHLPTPGTIGWHGALAARRGQLPVVGSYHTSFPDYALSFGRRAACGRAWLASPASALLRRGMIALLRAFYRRCDLILVPSPKAAEEVRSLVARPVDYFLRGVDTELFSPDRRREPTDQVVALYVGRVSVEKNLDVLLGLGELPGCRLKVVGDGPYRAELETALPAAEFTGYLRGEALAEAYASADLFVFPSLTDTLGNVVLEAKASGLPVVVMDPLGPGSVVRHEVDGFVEPTAKGFLAAVARLVAEPELRRQLGSEGRQNALTRRWPEVFDQLLGHYHAVLGDPVHEPVHQALPAV